jgi:hypothetical protein
MSPHVNIYLLAFDCVDQEKIKEIRRIKLNKPGKFRRKIFSDFFFCFRRRNNQQQLLQQAQQLQQLRQQLLPQLMLVVEMFFAHFRPPPANKLRPNPNPNNFPSNQEPPRPPPG